MAEVVDISAHVGVQPSTVIGAMRSELSRIEQRGTAGVLKTLKRYAADGIDLESIDRHILSGVPAMLLAYEGGIFDPPAANGRAQDQVMRFAIICAAGTFQGASDRLTGGHWDPGVEDLLDLATYFGLRGMRAAGVRLPLVGEHRWLRFVPEKYVAIATFTCRRQVDTWDSAIEGELEKLGICHDPTDPDDLWDPDNLTPNSDDPRTVDGGVATL